MTKITTIIENNGITTTNVIEETTDNQLNIIKSENPDKTIFKYGYVAGLMYCITLVLSIVSFLPKDLFITNIFNGIIAIGAMIYFGYSKFFEGINKKSSMYMYMYILLLFMIFSFLNFLIISNFEPKCIFLSNKNVSYRIYSIGSILPLFYIFLGLSSSNLSKIKRIIFFIILLVCGILLLTKGYDLILSYHYTINITDTNTCLSTKL